MSSRIDKKSEELVNLTPDEKRRLLEQNRKKFAEGHTEALRQWNKDHAGYPPPIIQDRNGTPHWLNRAQRRKQNKYK
jgi:hypothetical protein